ncbi:uncharacterized protein [Drosophila takahashii]|uniref:uncharacterized protein n=1 Tax=Drosophila takahashii TaxID=29030 RepID=UPI00389905E6
MELDGMTFRLIRVGGAKVMVSILRQQIWLINAREACTRIVRSYVHCFRYKPKLLGQIMGDLPADWVRKARPFLICGVDFCGPFYVSLKLRGKPPIKTYVAVFVGRRGLPEKVYSDNATNFVGASKVLEELHVAFHRNKDQLTMYAAQGGVEWSFIPPRSPHFGGLWEAAVKPAARDYLASLQQRNKWSIEGPDLKIGCLVLVHEDNLPPQRWLTGRVVATVFGEYGRVRVAEIQTFGGLIKRSIHKLALLPISSTNEEVKAPEAFNGVGMLDQ